MNIIWELFDPNKSQQITISTSDRHLNQYFFSVYVLYMYIASAHLCFVGETIWEWM